VSELPSRQCALLSCGKPIAHRRTSKFCADACRMQAGRLTVCIESRALSELMTRSKADGVSLSRVVQQCVRVGLPVLRRCES
jgi:hypothetical protein